MDRSDCQNCGAFDRLIRLVCWCTLIGSGLSLPTASADEMAPALAVEAAITKIAADAEPAVVAIARWRDRPNLAHNAADPILDRQLQAEADAWHPEFIPNDFGTGVLLAPPRQPGGPQPERLVLTNYHVVRDGPVYGVRPRSDQSRLMVYFASRRVCTATIYAADPRSDLAVLKLDETQLGIPAKDLPAVNWGEAGPVKKGQLVVMLGNPYALARDGSASVSWGIVSNLTRRPVMPTDASHPERRDGLAELGALMTLESRSPIGTSGSPVFNLKGELVGLGTSLAAIEGYERSGGFALPIDPLTRPLISALLAGQEMEYGLLGVILDDLERRPIPFGRDAELLRGVRILSVMPGSPAHQANLVPHQLILRVNNIPVSSKVELMRYVAIQGPEAEVELVVIDPPFSANQPRKVRAKLAKWPVREEDGLIVTNQKYPTWRGMRVDYATGRTRFWNRHFPILAAVVIAEVAEDSRASEAGLKPEWFITQVNRTPVTSPREFHQAVKNARGNVTLRVIDNPVRFPDNQPEREITIRD